MGDVKQFKPREPKDSGGVRILSCRCGQATWILNLNGYVECPICGSTYGVEALQKAGFLPQRH